jgi:hypothetical protein
MQELRKHLKAELAARGKDKLTEEEYHALISKYSGYSKEVVKRVLQCYWNQCILSWQDGQLVTVYGLGLRMALVLRKTKSTPTHWLNSKRLALIVDSPAYVKEKYNCKVRNSMYGKWVNMWIEGHQFLEI